MDNAIEARGLEKTYRGDVRALKGVSLAAAEGTVFGLLGPNGAGKSTTVKILTTLSAPDAGEAYVAGYNVVKQPGKVRLAIGSVAQKSGLDPQMTGRENLVLQGRVYGMRGAALRSSVSGSRAPATARCAPTPAACSASWTSPSA
jgi:ABC-2 type transport system ATP-binding protein